MVKHVDYIVVGLGIGGANICQELEKRDLSFIVFDDGREAASNMAAGLINPITGRNYAKSWRIDDLLVKARTNYTWFEERLGTRFHQDLDIRRVLNSIGEENKWSSRLGDPNYDAYLKDQLPETLKLDGFSSTDKIIKVHQGMRVDLVNLIRHYKGQLTADGRCLDTHLDFKEVDWNNRRYRDIKFDKMICCEGALRKNSPFDFLPIILNLGEVLLVHLKTSEPLPFALKKKVFIVPVEDYYWVGGTYTNISSTDNVKPDYLRLTKLFEEAYHGAYDVIDRRYGIRPTVPDRRPITGRHPDVDYLYVLNGLGTKGTSLSPSMASDLIHYIENGSTLDPEVDIKRYV